MTRVTTRHFDAYDTVYDTDAEIDGDLGYLSGAHASFNVRTDWDDANRRYCEDATLHRLGKMTRPAALEFFGREAVQRLETDVSDWLTDAFRQGEAA